MKRDKRFRPKPETKKKMRLITKGAFMDLLDGWSILSGERVGI
jgi:hypothetical protein